VGVIILIRHGETEWSATGRHTSTTDLTLTPRGEQESRALERLIAGRTITATLCSPRTRAQQTARLAGLWVNATDPDLAEWDYGAFEGLTTEQIHERDPGWSLWRDGAPGGESPAEVAARADRVLSRVRPLLDDGDVALVAHGHLLRVLGARWVGLPASGVRCSPWPRRESASWASNTPSQCWRSGIFDPDVTGRLLPR
jgi:probable phosphoglycerate mutase